MPGIESLLLKIKNRRLVVMVAPILLGVLAGGVLVVRPSLGKLGTIKSELSGLKEKEIPYNTILSGEKRLEGMKARFAGDKTWLIEQLNAIAQKTGFSILSILPEDPKRVGEYLDRTSVRIDAEGGYHQLGAFVSEVESLNAYVKILSLDINSEASSQQAVVGLAPGRARQGSSVYNISLSVGLYTPAPGVLG